MTNKIYIVTDLGPGDGGKGGVVHKICKTMNVHTVIKVGGGQGSHGVYTSSGQKFNFSHWGCGTLEGIKTHISNAMVIYPEALLNEANALKICGVDDPFNLLTVDGRAICSTHYHRIASHLKELARGKNPRGTVGIGIGEAIRYDQRFPALTIRAGDLSYAYIRDMLAAVREQVRTELAEIIGREFLPEDREKVEEEVQLLEDDDFLEFIVARFIEASRLIKITYQDYLKSQVFSKDGSAVVEKSHGILTDRFHGFYPHTSAIRTLPCFAQTMLRGAGYNGNIVNLGVFRAYAIRHGAGPMPTADSTMTESLLPGSSKEENRWQGKVRVGPLDMVLLRYAIEVCGGPNAFDGLAVTWFDQIIANEKWQICRQYQNADDRNFFSDIDAIKVRRGEDSNQLFYQEKLGAHLLKCVPVVETQKVSSASNFGKNFSICADIIREELGVPVRLVSFGRSDSDKVCK